MHRTKSWLFIGLLGISCQAAAGVTQIDLDLGYHFDDNLNRGEEERDRLSDQSLEAGIRASYNQMLSPNSGLRLMGSLRLVEQARYDELSQIAAGVGLRYRIQPVAGYTAPWIQLATGYEYLQYRDSEIRDGELMNAELMVGKRFTDRLGGRAGYHREWRDARDGDVFEWQRRTLFVGLDYRLQNAATVYFDVSRLHGDLVFTATPDPRYRREAKAIADDPAFGARRAYRMEASANQLDLGFNLPLGASSALDLGVRYFDADAEGGRSYDNVELRAGWLYRFK